MNQGSNQTNNVDKGEHAQEKIINDQDEINEYKTKTEILFQENPEEKQIHQNTEAHVKIPDSFTECEEDERFEDIGNIQEEKVELLEGGSSSHLTFAICGFQGARVSMEDSHFASIAMKRQKTEHNARSFQEPEHQEEHGQPEKDHTLTNQDLNLEHDEQPFDFFGVYDGHSGRKAAEFAAEHLHCYIAAQHELFSNPKVALTQAFLKLESDFIQLAQQEQLEDGTTAVVAIIFNRTLVIGNVGDSEAILCRENKAVPLSIIHNPGKNSDEKTRIVEAGGRLYKSRVGHPSMNIVFFNIAVSRAIGDMIYKLPEFCKAPSGITAEPDVNIQPLTPQDQFLILACDGLWDVLTYQQAVDFVLQSLKSASDLKVICKDLVHEAYKRGSADNITACIILFNSQ